MPINLRLYLPLLLETLLESPIERDGVLIPHEEVITQLQDDAVTFSQQIGVSGMQGHRFKCGIYSNTVSVNLQVEPSKGERGITWLRELLYQTKFTASRLKIIANKIINEVTQFKRSSRGMIRFLIRSLNYIEGAYQQLLPAPFWSCFYIQTFVIYQNGSFNKTIHVSESNLQINGVIKQQKFLTQLVEDLEGPKVNEVLENIEKLRNIITEPSNVILYCAADFETLPCDIAKAINGFYPPDRAALAKPQM